MAKGLTRIFSAQKQDRKHKTKLANRIVFLLLLASVIVSWFIGYHRATQGASTSGMDQFIDSIINGYTSSAILLLLFGIIQELNSRKATHEELVENIQDQIQNQFDAHYKLSTPLKVYEHSQTPTDAFRKKFVEHCSKSTIYITHGVGGDFTVFRIKQNIDSTYIKNKEVIRLHLLDPREDALLRQKAIAERALGETNNGEIQKIIDDLKEEIFCTIYWLYALGNKQRSKVILHKDTPFYRAEFFDDAVFLSFYLGGEYPGTLLYGKDSLIYRAFYKCLSMSESNHSLSSIQMGPEITQAVFEAYIRDTLNCQMNLQELKQKAEQRLDRIAKKMKSNKFSINSPF